MTERAPVEPATPKPCAQCPWRTANQGQRHPGSWYTKSNLRRLWAKLRRGERMTCHPTDPGNPIPEGSGLTGAPEGATTVECCGSLILQQREFMRYQAIMLEHPDLDQRAVMRLYRASHPRGLTLAGLRNVVERKMFGAVPLIGTGRMTTPDLNEEGIGHPDLVPWVKDEAR